MAKLDKTKYSKQEATRLMEIRRLEKMSGDKKEEFAKRAKPINFSQQEIVDESRFAHNQNSAFVLGNGLSRSSIEPEELKKYGPVYGCNALYFCIFSGKRHKGPVRSQSPLRALRFKRF